MSGGSVARNASAIGNEVAAGEGDATASESPTVERQESSQEAVTADDSLETIEESSSETGDSDGNAEAPEDTTDDGGFSQSDDVDDTSDTTNPELACLTESQVVSSGEQVALSWQLPYQGAVLAFEVSRSSDNEASDIGYLVEESSDAVTYYAPDTIPESMTVSVVAQMVDSTENAACQLTLKADEDIGVADDGLLDGLVGQVYQLEANTPSLPDFSTMTPLSSIVVTTIDIPQRSFDSGFPSIPDLYEWFGIQFTGKLTVPEDGVYDFSLLSDDGSNLYIDGVKVIDNDGTHAPTTKNGRIELTAGHHDIRLDYFQGPRYLIALQLFWKKADDSEFQIVPGEALGRPE